MKLDLLFSYIYYYLTIIITIFYTYAISKLYRTGNIDLQTMMICMPFTVILIILNLIFIKITENNDYQTKGGNP